MPILIISPIRKQKTDHGEMHVEQMNETLKGRHLVFVIGEDEYASEITMPRIAKEAEHKHGAQVTVLSAHPGPAEPANIPGLEALQTADLAVFYLRFRQLPEEQFGYIRAYLEAGKPVIGLRTSTHSFDYPEGHPLARWNDGFGTDVLGAPWIRHFGHSSSTDVSIAWGANEHPILRGVPTHFSCRSWLYQVLPYPPEGALLLLNGHTVNPEDNGWSYTEDTPRVQPVAWTRTHFGGGRVLTTTMGHPEDFEQPAFRRLLLNGIHWAVGAEHWISEGE
ncbi:ThuA domain-containing protein [Paenibacillus aceris]|uniref:Type 1 glutamine amidotransferase n=1 Tax=Paenibacillus aceris TaxID=869555 RepID=A0ABS4HX30_9BACL|nr:ThuA domain-containing protein [Paenibacillus aceris]MBP1963105.1 type 1 glutamine amidotransferase [Paenibacillus aceris]NHW38775.1 ThuA domain-containing protein [Paenibacillus aceris]